jgi:hypothetical protein
LIRSSLSTRKPIGLYMYTCVRTNFDCLDLTTLHTVRIYTCRNLDRHDYTYSIEVTVLHIHLDVHCLFCLFIEGFQLTFLTGTPLLHPLLNTISRGTEKVFRNFEKKVETGLETRSGHRGRPLQRPYRSSDPVRSGVISCPPPQKKPVRSQLSTPVDRDRRPGPSPADGPVQLSTYFDFVNFYKTCCLLLICLFYYYDWQSNVVICTSLYTVCVPWIL